MGIREDMPLLSSAEGIWDGWYRYYDAAGNKMDEHKSRLVCRFPTSGPVPYHQTNYYTWEDGKEDIRDFPAQYKDKRLWFDNELIKGWAAELTVDDLNRSMYLYWQRKGVPDLYLYEMINVSDCRKKRCRTWHWIKNGEIIQRTLIDEHFAQKDWSAYS